MKEFYSLEIRFKEFKTIENCSFAMSKLTLFVENNFLNSKVIPTFVNINNNEGVLVFNFSNQKNISKIINKIKEFLEILKEEYEIKNIEFKEIKSDL